MHIDDALEVPPDTTAACPQELLFQRGGLFTNGQIYRVDLLTYVEQPVSNGIDTDTDAEWSPDGGQVVLSRNGTSIWIVNRDGSNPREVDSSSAFLGSSRWSPDGTRVIYEALPAGTGSPTIFSASSQGTGSPVNLSPGADARGPLDWSPDGSTILFVSNRTGNLDVFTMATNGTNQRNLTNRSGGDTSPRWSPDGTRIVFVGQFRIWTTDSDGSSLQNLSGTAEGSYGSPVWSPDGTRIYFVANPDDAAQLFVMNANGANQHSIDSSTAIDLEPTPSPDGSRIAWSSKRDGNFEIYVSNADGTNPTRVTNHPSPDTRPRWRPCP